MARLYGVPVGQGNLADSSSQTCVDRLQVLPPPGVYPKLEPKAQAVYVLASRVAPRRLKPSRWNLWIGVRNYGVSPRRKYVNLPSIKRPYMRKVRSLSESFNAHRVLNEGPHKVVYVGFFVE